MKISPVFILLSSIFWFSMCSTHSGNGNRTPDTINSPKKNTAGNPAQIDSIENIFLGDWSNDTDESLLLNHIRIKRGFSMFHVCQQLGLKLKNIYDKDTLLLYVIDTYTDVDNDPGFPLPKRNSLFAKCFVIESCIRIRYSQESFANNMQTFALDTAFCFQFNDDDTLIGKEAEQNNHYEITLAGYYSNYMTAYKANVKNGRSTTNKFIGQWSNQIPQYGSFPFECLEIGNEASYFGFIGDQLSAVCKNVYCHDTLYLYVIETKTEAWFSKPSFPVPKPKSLLAKCYIVNSSIRIYYANKTLRDNIKKYELRTTFSYKNPFIR